MTIKAGDLPYGVVVEYCGEPYHIQDRDPEDEVDAVFVEVPAGVSWKDAEEAVKALVPSDVDLIDDLATALRKAWDSNSGLARYPVSDPVWGDLARVAIERVRADA